MTFAELLPRLHRRLHWRLFLCNLKLALDLPRPLLDADQVRAAFQLQPDARIPLRDASSLLGNLKLQMHAPPLRMALRSAAPGIPDEFVGRTGLITIMKAQDLRHYQDPKDFGGHDFDRPGWVSRCFKPDASTNDYFWAAPRAACNTSAPDGKLAESIRDLLGLVQHSPTTQLVALSLRPPATQRYCRPTIVEALPNPRFLQHHRDQHDHRWGYTVDLFKLDTVALGETIAGAPELLVEKVYLRDCTEVELLSLGRPQTNRDTVRSTRQFLRHLLIDSRFMDIYAGIAAKLGVRR